MLHHRMGSYYDPSGSSCPSPAPSMSDVTSSRSIASDASVISSSPMGNSKKQRSSYHQNGRGKLQLHNIPSSQCRPMTIRECTSPTPSVLQPRKGILMSPSQISQIPPPPPPTSSIPRAGNLKKPYAVMESASNQAQMMKIDQYYTTQPFTPTNEPFPVMYGMPGKSHSSAQHQLTRGRKLSPQKTLQQRLKFECEDMRQIHALNKRLASLTIADMSPRLALQRILLLYNRGDHR